MNRIEKMIADLCPNGVEWKELGEVCEFKRGTALTSKKAIEGNFPVISGGQKPAFTHNEFNRKANTIVVAGSGAYAGFVSYWEEPIFVADAFSVDIIDKDRVSTKYIFHFLKNNQEKIYSKKTGAGIPHVYGKDIAKFKVPIPPLKIQEEIVKILDTMTEHVAELKSELQMRTKQYEYYREDLLIFEDHKVEWKTLGEVATIQRGASPRPISKYITEDENGVPWIKIGDTRVNDKYISSTVQKITIEGAKKSRVLNSGDFIMSNSMSYGRPYILKIDGAIHDGWASISNISPDLNKNYLYYYLSSDRVKNYWDSKINSGSVSNLNSDIIKSLYLPIPSLEIQEKIVYVLDNFDKVCNDLNIGLPKEIELRQKEYEYYREKLLTFDVKYSKTTLDDTRRHENLLRLYQYVYGYIEVELGEIGKVSMCRRILKNQTDSSGDIPFYKIGTFGKEADSFITEELFNEYRVKYPYPEKGDILISASGTIGRTVIFSGEKSYYQDSNIVWLSHNGDLVVNKYLYYFYSLNPWKISSGGTISRLYNSDIEKVKIKIPSLEKQKQIVEILDKFDELVNSTKTGLNKEIELRQKQYEYWREKLLTF